MFSLIPRGQQNIFNWMDDVESRFFNQSVAPINQFRTDIVENEDEFVLTAELPGFDKEDIHVNVTDEYMTIKASHKEETKVEKDNYVQKERKFGSFSRSFDLAGIKADNISGEYKDGILTIELPKEEPQEEKPSSRKLELK